jgi:hypothetical protein
MRTEREIGSIKKGKEGRYTIKTETKLMSLARYKAEKVLGKHLNSKHPVHHANGDKSNDLNCNLVICESLAYHFLLHKRMRESSCVELESYQTRLNYDKENRRNSNLAYEAKVKQNKQASKNAENYQNNKLK